MHFLIITSRTAEQLLLSHSLELAFATEGACFQLLLKKLSVAAGQL